MDNYSDEPPKEFKKCLDTLFAQNCMVDVREGIQTLIIYLNNILKNPKDPKFRKIRVANMNYQERLGHLKGGTKLLTQLGFKEDGDFMKLPATMHCDDLTELTALQASAYSTLHTLNEKFGQIERHDHNHSWSSVKGCGETSTIGRRQSMEDDWYAYDKFGGSRDQGLFCVYDGHGGRQTVDFIVRAFWRNLAHLIARKNEETPTEWFETAYALTDGQVRRQRILQSGSTAVTCIVRKEGARRVLYAANVGDSRCILCRGSNALRLTKDHKATDAEEAKRVEADGGFVGRFNRVNGLLAISRAFGDHLLKPAVSAVPYQTRTELAPEDRFLILACDGVWDVMTDQEAVDFVLKEMPKMLAEANGGQAAGNEPSQKVLNECLVKCSKAIIDLALERRSMDNISVMMVWL